MDQPSRVGGNERFEHSAQNRQQLVDLEVAALLEPAVEGAALQEFHNEVLPTVGKGSEGEDIYDVLVADLVYGPSLGDEARDDLRIVGVGARKQLDCNGLTNERVNGAINRSKAAFADLGFNLVLTDHRSGHDLVLGVLRDLQGGALLQLRASL